MKQLFGSPKQLAKNLFLTVLGTLLLSIATSLFILPYNLVVGGMSGLAILFNAVLPIGKELWITIITVSLYLLGLIFLSKDFAMKTLISTIVYPLGVSLFSYLASPDVLGGMLYLPGSDYGGVDILLAALSAVCLPAPAAPLPLSAAAPPAAWTFSPLLSASFSRRQKAPMCCLLSML